MRESLEIPTGRDGFAHLRLPAGQPVCAPMAGRHSHAEVEMNLVRHGSGRYLVRNRRYDLRRHTIAWFFPGQEHVLLDLSHDFEMWIVVFRPQVIRSACTTKETAVLREEAPAGHFCRLLPVEPAQQLNALCREVSASQADAAAFNAGLRFLLLRAWQLYVSAPKPEGGYDLHPAVEQATRLLAEEENALRLEELARRAGLSPARLSRVFKRQVGISLTEYRNQRRVERFVKAYGEGRKMNMLAAALVAGFGSYAQFHRVFREVMGCAPAGYRKLVRETESTSGGLP
jgi:AraC-like DNA-binding protein